MLQESDGGKAVLASALGDLGLPIEAVSGIQVEYTPDNSIFADQQGQSGVDCDVLVRFDGLKGRGVLVSETKSVEEEFSTCGFRKKAASDERRCPEGTIAGADGVGCAYQEQKGFLYWQRTRENATLHDGVAESFCPFGGFLWQLWVNHTLAHALREEADSTAIFAVCAPKANTRVLDLESRALGKIDAFRELAREPDSVVFLAVEDVVAALESVTPADFRERSHWLEGLRARYLVA